MRRYMASFWSAVSLASVIAPGLTATCPLTGDGVIRLAGARPTLEGDAEGATRGVFTDPCCDAAPDGVLYASSGLSVRMAIGVMATAVSPSATRSSRR